MQRRAEKEAVARSRTPSLHLSSSATKTVVKTVPELNRKFPNVCLTDAASLLEKAAKSSDIKKVVMQTLVAAGVGMG